MNDHKHPTEEQIDRLVREHLLREEQTVDAAGILAGVRARAAARTPAPTPSTTPAVAGSDPAARRRRVRFALALAASVLLAVLWALPVATPHASAETLVREARQAHARPVELCYLRSEPNPPAGDGDVVPPEGRLWTRGDQFFMETVLGTRVNAWGRDAQGRVWFAPTPRAGFRFEAHEVPEPLARTCDLRSMNVDKLLTEVLANLELRRREAGPGLQIVEAEPKAGRPFVPLRYVRLEIDAHKKLLRRIEVHRRHPQGVAQITFTLVEQAPSRADADYTLEGHLEADASIYSLTDPPPLRYKMLRKHYEMGRRAVP